MPTPPPIAVVLVEPQGALNIGSVCRVMMNFGFADLRLVNPQVDHLCDDARRMAVKATPLLESARLFPSLAAAVADSVLTIGTTRRFGKYREDFIHPGDIAGEVRGVAGMTSLVFGREDRGLLTDELDLCTRLVTIPTDEALPSLNLAQAVAVCLYEVALAGGATVAVRRRKVATSAAREAMYRHMRDTLAGIGYLDPQNPDHILRTFRRIFARSGLNDREVRILQGLWSRLDWIEAQRRKGGE